MHGFFCVCAKKKKKKKGGFLGMGERERGRERGREMERGRSGRSPLIGLSCLGFGVFARGKSGLFGLCLCLV